MPFTHETGEGLNVNLHSLPLHGKLVLLPYEPEQRLEKDPNEEKRRSETASGKASQSASAG
jgi:hypothetical protein